MDTFEPTYSEGEIRMVNSPSGSWVRKTDVDDLLTNAKEQTIVDCMEMIAGMRRHGNSKNLVDVTQNIVVNTCLRILSSCLDVVRKS